MAYNSLVWQILEYEATVWDTHTQSNIHKIEIVQRRATGFVKYERQASVSSLLKQLQWPTLEERRTHMKVIMLHRIINKQVILPTQVLIPMTTARGYTYRFMVPFARAVVYQKSFYPPMKYATTCTLPATKSSCHDADIFKRQLR